jgi:hypothetical protein
VRDLKADLKRLEESRDYFEKHGNYCLKRDLEISIIAIKRAITAEELIKEIVPWIDRVKEAGIIS